MTIRESVKKEIDTLPEEANDIDLVVYGL